MKIVIDTNVFISAALSPKGTPAKIIKELAEEERLQLFYTAEIFDEYERVLSYKRLNIAEEMKTRTLRIIKELGIVITPIASVIPMPDETDRIFYDTAKASGSILITGNLRHYPQEPFILSPSDFLKLF